MNAENGKKYIKKAIETIDHCQPMNSTLGKYFKIRNIDSKLENINSIHIKIIKKESKIRVKKKKISSTHQ